MTSPESKPVYHSGEDGPRRLLNAQLEEGAEVPPRRLIEVVSDESDNGDDVPVRGYGGEDGRYAADGAVHDDVEGSASRAVAGPRRVEEAQELERESVDTLVDAIERGDVTPEESATKMAELTAHIDEVTAERDALAEKVALLEAETRALNEKLTRILEKLDQMGVDTSEMGDVKPVLSDEESIALGDSILERLGRKDTSSAEAGDFTSDDQEALQKKLAEDDDSGAPGTDLVKRPGTELEKIDRTGPLAAIREELAGSESAEKYTTALGRYAELKAKSETKGWIGRKGREKELIDAESALIEAKIAYERDVLKAAGERGLYPGDQEMARQRVADDMFNALRGLDGETRQAVNDVHDSNKEKRNVFTKAAATVGRFLTSGGKVAQWVKAGGSGLVAGFGIGTFGLGIPITTIAGIGLGLGVRGAATVSNLDKIRAEENKDARGNAVTMMDDETFRTFMRESATAGATEADRAQALAQRILEKSRERGYEQADRARKDARKTMGKFGLGFAAGMFTGNYVHDAFSSAHATDVGADAIDDSHAGDKVDDIEFSQGADRISSGEGWYSQFNDMGMSHKEARMMFRDSALMDKLVDMGAAYVDNSTRIGGYGINMPKGGHLSAKAMELIGQAMQAKGF